MISVSNIETSKPFYEAVLGLLNYDLAHGSDTYAMGACIAPSLSLASPLREVCRRRVFFNWAQEGERFMYSSDATTGDEPVRLPLFPSDPADAASHFDVTPSPDGGWITFASTQSSRSQDIFVMRPDGSDITNLTQSDGSADYEPTWSPRFRGFRPLQVYGDQQLYQRITFATIDLPSLAAIYLLTIGAIT